MVPAGRHRVDGRSHGDAGAGAELLGPGVGPGPGGNLGFALGPILATWMLAGFNLKGTALLMIPGCLMAAAIHWYRREIEVPTRDPERGHAQGTSPIPWVKLSALCVLISLRSWGYSGLIIFLPLFLLDQGVAFMWTGRALFIFLFFGALGGLLGGH